MTARTDPARTGDIDTLPVLLVACFATSVGAIIFNTMPVLLGILAETRGFGEGELSIMAFAILSGSMIAVVSALFWVDRVSWPPVMLLAAAGALATSLALPFATDATASALTLGAMGCLLGVLYAPALAALAAAANPPRAFATAVAMQVVFSALIAYLLPASFLPWFGDWAITAVIASGALVLVLTYPWMPVRRKQTPSQTRDEAARHPVGAPLAGMLGLASMGIFYVGIMGVWEFLERLGGEYNLSQSYIGGAIATALIIGASGAVIPMLIGHKFGHVKPVVMAIAVLLTSVFLLATDRGAMGFAAGVVLLNIGWNLSIPFFYAVIAEADPSGRLIVLSVSVQTAGAVVGSLAAGALIVGVGFSALFVFLMLCIMASLSIHWIVVHRLARLDLLPAHA